MTIFALGVLTNKIEEEFKGKVEGVIVRADIDLFKDHFSNVLAIASHPHHSGGCVHLSDDKERHRDRLGDRTATLPKVTDRPKMPPDTSTSPVLWKVYELKTKVYNLETLCRDECMKFIVAQYPVIMGRLKKKFHALPLHLTLQQAFEHIFSNVTDVVDTRE